MKTALQIFILGVLLCAGSTWAADRVSADALLLKAPDLVKEGNFKTVEELCKRSLQSDDTCPTAHFYMGIVLEKSGKAREAVKSYQLAASIATKEKDAALASKATAAAKKLGAGLIELDALDTKLAEKLTKIAAEAFDAGQLETAKQAYASLLVLQPENEKLKEALEKCNKALEERGDPVKTKIAAAALSEMWFQLGIGAKAKAHELANSLVSKYPETEPGKEAAGLIERDFAAPKQDEVAKLTERLKSESVKKVAAAPKVTPSSPSSTTPVTGSKPSGAHVDVDSAQKLADDETKKMAKEALVPAFKEAHKKGKEFYAKATPGSEGNQENIAKALEQFIKADSIYPRIEAEKLENDELAANAKEVGILHYACLKMTILAR